MRRRLATPLALLSLSLPIAACGESEKDKYIDDFKPLNDKLLAFSQDLTVAVDGAEEKNDEALAEQFGAFGTRLKDVNRDIEGLDTPAELEDEAKALNDRLDAMIEDLDDIAEAARKHDGGEAAAATLQLSSDAQDVNTAQNQLAKATGAEVGGR